LAAGQAGAVFAEERVNADAESSCRRGAVFFFSSRRRHTSFSRDWSSDVCSSDLCSASGMAQPMMASPMRVGSTPGAWSSAARSRSEERRVGKEGRARGVEMIHGLDAQADERGVDLIAFPEISLRAYWDGGALARA